MNDPHDADADWDANPVNRLLLTCVEAPTGYRIARLKDVCLEYPQHAKELRRRFERAVDMGLVDTGDDGERDHADASKERTIGPYRILDELGRGGQAVVYLAEHRELKRKVALKVLATFDASMVKSDSRLIRFRREAEVASRLDHPHICSVYEAGEEDGLAWIAMRYVVGKTLGEKIAKSRETKAATTHVVSLPESSGSGELSDTQQPTGAAPVRGDLLRAVVLIEKVARALHVAHEHGLVHRDIKPGNIMVTDAGLPVLLDFGMARDEESLDYSVTQVGELMGTPYYMSPEQLLAKHVKLDRRTDIYSLGVTLYECITLRRPFDAPTREGLYRQISFEDAPDPRRYNKHIPRDLKVVIESAIDSNPARRYDSALEFADDLRRFLSFESIRARPTGVLLRTTRWIQRHRIASAFLALVSVSLAITAGLLAEVSNGLRQSRALNLVAAAKEELPRDVALSLLLAREAVRLDPRQVDIFHRVLAERIPTADVRHPAHPETVWGTCGFSRDGERLLTIHGRDERLEGQPTRAAVWSSDGTLLTTIEPTADIRGWMISADGQHVALYLMNRELGVWQVRDDDPYRPPDWNIVDPIDPLSAIKADPDSDQFWIGSKSRAVRRYDFEGNSEPILPEGTDIASEPLFKKDGRIAFATADGHVEVRKRNGELIDRTSLGGRAVTLRASASLETIFARLANGSSVLVNNDTRRVVPIDPEGAGKCIDAVVSSNGRRILSFHDRGQHLWDESGTHLVEIPGGGLLWTRHVRWRRHAFAPFSNRFVMLDAGSSRLQIFSPDGKLEFSLSTSDAWARNVVHWLGRGDRLLFSHRGTVDLFAAHGKLLWSFRDPGGFEHTAISHDEKRFATTTEDGRVVLWDIERQDLPSWTHDTGHKIYQLELSEDGKIVATSDESGVVRVSTRDGAELAVFPSLGRPVSGIALSRDSQRIAACTYDEFVVWDLATKKRVFERKCDREYKNFRKVQFSPDGQELLFAIADESAVAWRLDDPAKPRTTFEHGGIGRTRNPRYSKLGDRVVVSNAVAGFKARVSCFTRSGDFLWDHTVKGPQWTLDQTFSPDGAHVLVSYDKGRIEILTRDGDLVRVIEHPVNADAVKFSADGKRFVTAGEDHAVRIWTLEGKLLSSMRGHRDRVRSATFTPDGTRVLTCSFDGTIRTWYANSDELRKRAFALPIRNFTKRELVNYAELLDGR